VGGHAHAGLARLAAQEGLPLRRLDIVPEALCSTCGSKARFLVVFRHSPPADAPTAPPGPQALKVCAFCLLHGASIVALANAKADGYIDLPTASTPPPLAKG
jgi:hypothetical protein